MTPSYVRRPRTTGTAVAAAAVVLATGCGDAQETPYFDETVRASGGASGSSQGGVSGNATGGSASGGTSTGGSAAGGSAGFGGTVAGAGMAGFGATSGTGSGGMAGAATGGTGSVSANCPAVDPAAVSFENHCYVLRSTPRTWAAARDDCSSHGAHLVVIGSDRRSEAEFAAENAFVWNLAAATEVWIGATDGRQSNQPGNGTPYAWINAESITYDRWSSGQPNNSQSACMDDAPCSCGDMCWEHCAFLWDPDNDEPGTWNDRHCEHLIGYVCEWDGPPT